MLQNYWPKEAQVNACIKNEAETADVAVLLAVHQPSALTTIDVGSGAATPVSEDDLLEAFLTDNVPGGTLLFPITGASGAGKSHIIRWLDAQLQRSAKREQLHIIRIPKSASLRTVVELILEPLKDNPRYKDATEDLKRAVAEVDVGTAAVTFRAHLENALAEIRKKLEVEVQQHPERAAALRPKIGHARDLPKLFSDPALSQHFIDTVLSRVVSRALRGRSETDEEEDDQTQFTTDDLVLPPTVNLADASMPVRQYYTTVIASSDRARVAPAVEILNQAIDPAIGNVFQLQQSTGGITLQDIILAVRKTLLDEGKDLVLLVEDFAALSGIQDVLLKVCIQEGERDGQRVRATMRTAIALTDGVLSFRETIYTRAQREWVVGGRALSDDEIRTSAVEMVGAYLNAARWGDDALKRKFAGSEGRPSSAWLESWRDEDDDDAQGMLRAFGSSNAGHPLFPFNRAAIAAMVDAHLVKNGQLVLNPRKVINSILRNTLLLRGDYTTNAFPSADQRAVLPNAWLAGWVRRAGQSEANRRRLGPLLAIWGGNPTTEEGIANVAPGIFTGFGLPTPADLANITFVPPAQPIAPVAPTKPSAPSAERAPSPVTPEPSAPDPWFAEQQAKLEAWTGGTPLGQAEANAIRSALAGMIKDAINWPALRLRPQPIRPGAIHIANAKGNTPAKRVIQVCESHEDSDGRIRAGMLGALRFARNQQRWTYDQAADDYVAATNLVDRLIAQLTPMLLDEANRQINAIARGLVTQARIAGLAPPVKLSNVQTALSAAFSPLPAMENQAFDDGWEKVRASVWAETGGVAARKTLQDDLRDLLGAFQGAGSVLFGLDGVRLLDALAAGDKDDESETSLPDELGAETRGYLNPLNAKRLWAQIQGVIAKLRTFRTELSDYIDADFDKTAFIAELEAVASLLSSTGNWTRSDISLKEFERRLVDFRATPIIDLVKKASLVDEANAEQLPKVLNALGALDLSSVERTVSFLSMVDQIITGAEQTVDRVYSNHEQANPGKIAGEIDALLTALADEGSPAVVEGAIQ
ncbi:protein DpdH [Phenylobacterium koreense]|uniref:ATP-binding protein n=1 Tax=Phenylobacterium koreense TaxID=266125 RepID=A0ABV2EJI7_9CAUL